MYETKKQTQEQVHKETSYSAQKDNLLSAYIFFWAFSNVAFMWFDAKYNAESNMIFYGSAFFKI